MVGWLLQGALLHSIFSARTVISRPILKSKSPLIRNGRSVKFVTKVSRRPLIRSVSLMAHTIAAIASSRAVAMVAKPTRSQLNLPAGGSASGGSELAEFCCRIAFLAIPGVLRPRVQLAMFAMPGTTVSGGNRILPARAAFGTRGRAAVRIRITPSAVFVPPDRNRQSR